MRYTIVNRYNKVIVRCEYSHDRDMFFDCLTSYYPDITFMMRDDGEEL